jgi:hypothetical protein
MPLTREFSVSGWTIGAGFSPGCLMVGIAWEVSPPGFFLSLPLLHFWLEHAETDYDRDPWSWCWSLFRLTIRKTELRLDLDLNDCAIGLSLPAIDDFAFHFGPLNVQIETDKMYDVDFLPEVPTLRLFFPPGRSVQTWPPRFDCGFGSEPSEGDDVIDPADGSR